jgi:ATP-binding cassette subfamily B multidrug efflux pump
MIPMAILPIAVVWFGRRIHTRFEQIQEQFSTISNFAQENLAGIRIVKAYVREQDQSERFAALNREYMSRNMALARVWGGFFPTLQLFGGLAARSSMARSRSETSLHSVFISRCSCGR